MGPPDKTIFRHRPTMPDRSSGNIRPILHHEAPYRAGYKRIETLWRGCSETSWEYPHRSSSNWLEKGNLIATKPSIGKLIPNYSSAYGQDTAMQNQTSPMILIQSRDMRDISGESD